MPLTPSLKVIKEFSYRGDTKRFTNRYHFNGGTPADLTEWTTLANLVGEDEADCYGAEVTIVGWSGYEAGSDAPVASGDYIDLLGTIAFTDAFQTPGDVAALVRYSTTARTSKNHPIYLANYYHGARYDSTDPPDAIAPQQKTALEAYADQWMTGYSDGVHTCVRAGPNGATVVARRVAAFLTHRDFRT